MKYLLLIIAIAFSVGCTTAQLERAQVVLDKAKTVSALVTLEASARDAYSAVSVNIDVFSDQEVIALANEWQKLVEFRISMQNLSQGDNILLSADDFLQRLTTVRGHIDSIILIIEANLTELPIESRGPYMVVVSDYRRISDRLDARLGVGNNEEIARLFLASLRTAATVAGSIRG